MSKTWSSHALQEMEEVGTPGAPIHEEGEWGAFDWQAEEVEQMDEGRARGFRKSTSSLIPSFRGRHASPRTSADLRIYSNIDRNLGPASLKRLERFESEGSASTGRNNEPESRDDPHRKSLSTFRRRSLEIGSTRRQSLSLPMFIKSPCILEQSQLREATKGVPRHVPTSQMHMIYSTFSDKRSFKVLYKRVVKASSTLLVIRERSGNIFGAFVNEPWRVYNSYFGSADTYVFSFNGKLQIHSASGNNMFFQLCRHDHLAVGGGKGFAIFVYDNLKHGLSKTSETFQNPPLAGQHGTEKFEIDTLEVWKLS